jgi:hypothetical protein
MEPTLDPAFGRTAARLASVPWAANVGLPLSTSLSEWCTPVTAAAKALELLNSQDWETWSANRQGALTSFLSMNHRQRFLDWNPIARRAKESLEPHIAAITDGLQAAGMPEKVALDTVEWDIIAALTCAAFLDCRPPTDELRLLDVYEAGHLPVGWDDARGRVLVF